MLKTFVEPTVECICFETEAIATSVDPISGNTSRD